MTKLSLILLGMWCVLVGGACSLVTVPVKTIGSLAETTVKTAGGVVEAPFKAMGGGREQPPEEDGKKK